LIFLRYVKITLTFYSNTLSARPSRSSTWTVNSSTPCHREHQQGSERPQQQNNNTSEQGDRMVTQVISASAWRPASLQMLQMLQMLQVSIRFFANLQTCKMLKSVFLQICKMCSLCKFVKLKICKPLKICNIAKCAACVHL
jgi:maltodextrin utilization protein YvdJ